MSRRHWIVVFAAMYVPTIGSGLVGEMRDDHVTALAWLPVGFAYVTAYLLMISWVVRDHCEARMKPIRKTTQELQEIFDAVERRGQRT